MSKRAKDERPAYRSDAELAAVIFMMMGMEPGAAVLEAERRYPTPEAAETKPPLRRMERTR